VSSEGDLDRWLSVNTSVVQSLLKGFDASLSFLKGFDCHPVHLLFFDAKTLFLGRCVFGSFLGFLEDGDHLRAALCHLLSNYTQVQVSIIWLIFVAVVDDLPLLDAVPSTNSRADVFFGINVGKINVVGAEVGNTTIRANCRFYANSILAIKESTSRIVWCGCRVLNNDSVWATGSCLRKICDPIAATLCAKFVVATCCVS
jgi:hypothetical protein